MYIYKYMYIYVYMYICIYVYIHIHSAVRRGGGMPVRGIIPYDTFKQ